MKRILHAFLMAAIIFWSPNAWAEWKSLWGIPISEFKTISSIPIDEWKELSGIPVSTTTNFLDDASIQGAWYMNGNGTNETDRSGNNITLNQYGGTIPTSTTVPSGYSGTSRDFEADDTECLYVTDANAAGLDITGNAITITAWVQVEAIVAHWRGVVYKSADAGGNNQYYMGIYGTGTGNQFKAWFGISTTGAGFTGSDGAQVEGTTTLNSGQMIHLAGVYNGTDLRFYINGSLACTPVAQTGNIYNGSADFIIGAAQEHTLGSGSFDGPIDGVEVFSRALSASEINEIYTSGADGSNGGND